MPPPDETSPSLASMLLAQLVHQLLLIEIGRGLLGDVRGQLLQRRRLRGAILVDVGEQRLRPEVFAAELGRLVARARQVGRASPRRCSPMRTSRVSHTTASRIASSQGSRIRDGTISGWTTRVLAALRHRRRRPVGPLAAVVDGAARRAPHRPAGRSRPSGGRYVIALVTSIVARRRLGALSLLAMLQGWRAFTEDPRRRAAVHRAGAHKLRVYLVPIDNDGARGATEIYDLDGDEWQVGGDVLRFRPFMTALGVQPVFRLTRVEGRWNAAADANATRVRPTIARRRRRRGSGSIAAPTRRP